MKVVWDHGTEFTVLRRYLKSCKRCQEALFRLIQLLRKDETILHSITDGVIDV